MRRLPHQTTIGCTSAEGRPIRAAQLSQNLLRHQTVTELIYCSSSVGIDQPIDDVSHSGHCYDDETAVWTLMQSAAVSLLTLNLESDHQITSC
ncbi:Hypothetical predicted protein [Scomber scombrus]|uniref:Uncharacterized protein n=1 Tax=Scomber scombrus TaxID=13677 RepID=A0AAV1PRP4_SCOSC